MNMTGAPPATESGKPGCPLLDKTSRRQLRHQNDLSNKIFL
jgi:hypothetical protein